MVRAGAETAEPGLAIHDPYVFEFLRLKAKDAVEESDLEAALVSNLRDFLLELGHGFCLEAQQQKDHALVEYALAAIDNRLFVSKYQVELPSRD